MTVVPEAARGLVFDCDGTIADTMPLHYNSWVETLYQFGIDFPEALFYELAGIPTPRIVEILNERYGYALPVKDVAHRKEHCFEQRLPEVVPIKPVVDLIHKYSGKLPMAVATGGSHTICVKTLTMLGLIDKFKTVVTCDDIEHPKPAPDIFLEAARRLDVEPHLCVAFEDADLGIQAAHAAGMIVVDIRTLVAPV
jgi:beta-phosphoglucomutase family hydrolase